MRRATSALLLFFAACASAPSDHAIRVTVSEIVAQTQPRAAGTHMMRIRILNASAQPMTIEMIRLQPGDSSLMSDDMSQRFDTQIDPGGTEVFDMYMTVSTTNLQARLESVEVTVNGFTNNHEFVDSGTYTIHHEIAGS